MSNAVIARRSCGSIIEGEQLSIGCIDWIMVSCAYLFVGGCCLIVEVLAEMANNSLRND